MDNGTYQILSIKVEITPHEKDIYQTVYFTPEGTTMRFKKIFLKEDIMKKIFNFAASLEDHQDKRDIKAFEDARRLLTK